MPLHCEAGWCRAEFISFCLQKTRRFPAKGTVYQIAETGGLTLALVDGAGRVRHLDAAPYVEIETPRAGHAAVTIALAQATLAKLGARGAAIEVAALVTLTPRAVPGDRSPQGIEELREASVSHPAHSARWVPTWSTAAPARSNARAASSPW